MPHQLNNMNAMNQQRRRANTGGCFIFFGFGLIVMGIFLTVISSKFNKFDGGNTPRTIGICLLSIGGFLFVMGILSLAFAKSKHHEAVRTTNNANATMDVYTLPPVTAGYTVGQFPPGQYLPGQYPSGQPLVGQLAPAMYLRGPGAYPPGQQAFSMQGPTPYPSGQQPVGQLALAMYLPGPGACPPGQQAFSLLGPTPYPSQPYSSHDPYSTYYLSTSGKTVPNLPQNTTNQDFDAPPPSYETAKKSRVFGDIPVRQKIKGEKKLKLLVCPHVCPHFALIEHFLNSVCEYGINTFTTVNKYLRISEQSD